VWSTPHPPKSGTLGLYHPAGREPIKRGSFKPQCEWYSRVAAPHPYNAASEISLSKFRTLFWRNSKASKALDIFQNSSETLRKEFAESSEPKYPFKRLRRFGVAMVNRHQAWVIVSHSNPQSAMHIWTREPTIGFPRDVGSGGKYLSIKLDRLPLFCSVFTLVKTANKGQDTRDVNI
jgi:hypothetical protein